MPPVTVYWYEGSMAKNFKPPQGLTPEDMKGVNEIFVGTKGYLGTSGRGESFTPASAIQAGGPPAAARGAQAFARPFPGLDSGLQGRRAGVLQLHHRRALHGMDAAGRDLLAIPQ